MTNYNVTVIGPGALGKTLMSILLASGFSVHGLTRNKISKQLSFNFNSVNGIKQKIDVSINDDAKLMSADLIVMTVKAFDIKTVLDDLSTKIKASVPIIILNNGIALNEAVIYSLGKITEQIIQGITTIAAFSDSKEVFQKSLGTTYLGLVLPKKTVGIDIKNNQVVKQFLTVLSHCMWVENIHYYQYEKLAINAIINPLTVKYKCKNGDLVAYQKEIQTLADEISTLYAILLPYEDAIKLNAEHLAMKAINIIQETKDNFSSMHQDFIMGRKSEIDYILGFLLEEARSKAIRMPFTECLFNDVDKILALHQYT